MRAWKNMILFYVGGMLYTGVELLWRHWSHGSMFLVGGTCFWLIGHLDERFPQMPVLLQMLLGTGIIVTAEFTSGMILNQWLGLKVWDYSMQPYNIMGQICLPYTLLWFPVSGMAVLAEDWLRHGLFGEPMPRYRWI